LPSLRSPAACSLLFLIVADPLDHATGLEKREMIAHLAGNDVGCDFQFGVHIYFYGFAVLVI